MDQGYANLPSRGKSQLREYRPPRECCAAQHSTAQRRQTYQQKQQAEVTSLPMKERARGKVQPLRVNSRWSRDEKSPETMLVKRRGFKEGPERGGVV